MESKSDFSVKQSVIDGIGTVYVAGRFTFNSHREFRSACAAVCNAAPKSLAVNLSQTDYLDSSALGMLLMLRDQAQRLSISIKIVGARGVALKVLEVANFQKLFEIKSY